MPVTVPEQLGIETEIWRRLLDGQSAEMHCAKPGIIQSWDGAGTVTVLLAVMERVTQPDMTVADTPFPVLVDVPILMPRSGGFACTMPISPGDECLVIFADIGIDWWWHSGGCQNKTQDLRRHDLSDGFAILGPWSKPRNLSAYPATSARIGKEDGSAYFEVTTAGVVNIVASAVNITSSGTIAANASGAMTLAGSTIAENGTLSINSNLYHAHAHTNVQPGSSVSGPVTP